MNNLVLNALNSTEVFIKANNLKPKIAYLTLLYYQFSYLRDLPSDSKDKTDIVCSYYEVNFNNPYVVIMSYEKETGIYTLKRIKLKEEVYKDLETSNDNDGELTIDDKLAKQFSNLYRKYSKGDKYEQLFCQRH